MRSDAAKIERVRALQASARTIASDRELRAAIVESTGLSSEGVDLAFEKHLELDATDADLAHLIARASDAESVAVVLSANVFVGALRAIAIAVAASTDVRVRPSRRDPAFAQALCEAAHIPLIESVDAIERGEIHVYGRDETITEIRAHARVPVRGHGPGMGVAWITKDADLDASARSLCDDVVVFDQRGCLSPRIVLVEGDRADAFAGALHDALEDAQALIPRGGLSSAERAESARYISTLTYAGRVLVGTAHAIGIAPAIIAVPAYRHVHIIATDDPRAVLAPIARAITAMGSDDLEATKAFAPTWARLSSLGAMQRPPLDGPVDLRDFEGAAPSS